MDAALPRVPTKPSFRQQNNLQWLRLLFAIQVVIVHASEHLWHTDTQFASHLPGVPAFFFVSGFLIYSSWQNAPGTAYFANRFLRLWPALIFVTLGGVCVALVARGADDLRMHSTTYAAWVLAQLTLGQWYNPELFRNVGLGVINGSLWTITVEIIFYLIVPLIAHLEKSFRQTVPVLMLCSFMVYAVGPHFLNMPVYRQKTAFEALSMTPIVWGWMFGFGIIAVKNFDKIDKFLKYGASSLPVLLALWLVSIPDNPFLGSTGNRLGVLYFVAYATLILWISFRLPYIKLKTDLSYGLYIWHMPVINLLIILQRPDPLLVACGVTVMCLISWFAIERPTLRLKRQTLHKV